MLWRRSCSDGKLFCLPKHKTPGTLFPVWLWPCSGLYPTHQVAIPDSPCDVAGPPKSSAEFLAPWSNLCWQGTRVKDLFLAQFSLCRDAGDGEKPPGPCPRAGHAHAALKVPRPDTSSSHRSPRPLVVAAVGTVTGGLPRAPLPQRLLMCESSVGAVQFCPIDCLQRN